MKTVRPKQKESKTGRKFEKLHIDNVKRPVKRDLSLPGTSWQPSPSP